MTNGQLNITVSGDAGPDYRPGMALATDTPCAGTTSRLFEMGDVEVWQNAHRAL